jgi:hypothetical protein
MTITSRLRAILDFVRAGYPEGIPPTDYFPILALLRRRLSDEEVAAVADELIATSSDPGAAAPQIRQAIESLTKQPASATDLARVQNRLAAVGLDLDTDAP